MSNAEAFEILIRLNLSIDVYSGWVHQYGNHFTYFPLEVTKEEGAKQAIEQVTRKINGAIGHDTI